MFVNKLLLSVLFLPLTIALIFFLVLPKYDEFKNINLEVTIKKAEKNAKYAYYAEIDKVFMELEKRKEGVEKIDRAIPDQEDLSSLVNFFQEKSFENGLIIKNLFFTRSSGIDKNKNLKEVAFSLNIVGSYSSLKNLLYSIEKSANLFEVGSISFSSANSKIPNAQQPYSFSIEIKSYSY